MIPDLVTTYQKTHEFDDRGTAVEINRQTGIPNFVTHQSIYNWRKGIHSPRPALMATLYKLASGDIKDLAGEILKVLERQPVQG